MWLRLAALVAGAALILVAIAGWHAQRRWDAVTHSLRTELLAGTQPAPVAHFDGRELDGLPRPVARYFRRTLRQGQPLIRRARVTWRGEFNLGEPGHDDWKPLEAVQQYVAHAAGFVWDARIAMLPGVPVLVRDAFVAGRGSMHGAVLGLVPVVERENTPGLAAAALQRHLGEAIWFPTALLPSQGVRWKAIDDSRALATLTAAGVTATLEFRFGADGLPTEVYVPDRVYDDGRSAPSRHPWRARNLEWMEVDGVPVPRAAIAEWALPGGTYAYWRGGPVKVEYEF